MRVDAVPVPPAVVGRDDFEERDPLQHWLARDRIGGRTQLHEMRVPARVVKARRRRLIGKHHLEAFLAGGQ
jgi:hypothetical protein